MAIEEERAAHATSSLAERVARRYLLYLLIVPILGYMLPFLLERNPKISPWLGTPWSQILDTNYDHRKVDADVVIFGDSVAAVDLDTARLSQELGMKVVNVPSTGASLPVTGDLFLRMYLAVNRPPRLIVFFFAPFDLNFSDKKKSLTYEGYEQLVRHDSLRQLASLLRDDPLAVLGFPFRFYAVTLRWRPKDMKRVTVVQGHTPFWSAEHVPDDCDYGENYRGDHNTEPTQKLVRTFTSAQTKTLVFLSPIPDCSQASDFVTRRYDGLEVAPPVVLPRRNFADMTHVQAAAVPLPTELLRGAISRTLGSQR